MPNVLVLSFTRALTEFIRTGCYDAANREIFPRTLVSTIESWIRGLYKDHGETLPSADHIGFSERKAAIASEALVFVTRGRVPRYDTIFVDEAQDLLSEEVELLRAWSPILFFVGDDRQRIYNAPGLQAVRQQIPALNEERLKFHYRLARELCDMADRIQTTADGSGLAATSHYDGPKPGRVTANGPLTREQQIAVAAERLKDQLRAYGDLIAQGDRLGVIVPRRGDREAVFAALDVYPSLKGKLQIVRARSGAEGDSGYDPAFDPSCAIAILTEAGSKGLEFRASHWLFCDEQQHRRTPEIYYTIVTRPKTSLDLYFKSDLPATLAKAYAPPSIADW